MDRRFFVGVASLLAELHRDAGNRGWNQQRILSRELDLAIGKLVAARRIVRYRDMLMRNDWDIGLRFYEQ